MFFLSLTEPLVLFLAERFIKIVPWAYCNNEEFLSIISRFDKLKEVKLYEGFGWIYVSNR